MMREKRPGLARAAMDIDVRDHAEDDQNDCDNDFDAWLDADSADECASVCSDSDYDPDEARDVIGVLKTFPRRLGIDQPIAIIFVVDVS